MRLAAGERQLVAFARAWLADPVLLDEATSQLEVASEARVREALRTLRQGRTTIMIAHRLTSVLDADQGGGGRDRPARAAAGRRRPLRRPGEPAARGSA